MSYTAQINTRFETFEYYQRSSTTSDTRTCLEKECVKKMMSVRNAINLLPFEKVLDFRSRFQEEEKTASALNSLAINKIRLSPHATKVTKPSTPKKVIYITRVNKAASIAQPKIITCMPQSSSAEQEPRRVNAKRKTANPQMEISSAAKRTKLNSNFTSLIIAAQFASQVESEETTA